jgi:hypothetical protein
MAKMLCLWRSTVYELSNIEGKNHGELQSQGKFLFVDWGLFPAALNISIS